MTQFTDLIAALEEAEYLAIETGKRHALVSTDNGYSVASLADARECGMTVLEVVRP